MAETTADVRRDIELTRERMSDTIAQLERKLNLLEIVREHPWPSIALAVGAGFALAGSNADAKAAAATVKATGGASSKLGELLDVAAASAITAASSVIEEKLEAYVGELKEAIGATPNSTTRSVSGNGAPATATTQTAPPTV